MCICSVSSKHCPLVCTDFECKAFSINICLFTNWTTIDTIASPHRYMILLRDNIKSSTSPKKGNSLRLFLDPPAPPKKEIMQTVENPSFSDA